MRLWVEKDGGVNSSFCVEQEDDLWFDGHINQRCSWVIVREKMIDC